MSGREGSECGRRVFVVFLWWLRFRCARFGSLAGNRARGE